MHKVHLDIDLGGDIDDLCALAMLLRWSEKIHLTGVTTVAEANGRRAGYAKYLLDLEGKHDIPVAAGKVITQATPACVSEWKENNLMSFAYTANS